MAQLTYLSLITLLMKVDLTKMPACKAEQVERWQFLYTNFHEGSGILWQRGRTDN